MEKNTNSDYFTTKPSLTDKDGRIDTQCKEDILSRSEKKSKNAEFEER